MYFKIFGAVALLATCAVLLTIGVGLLFDSFRRASRRPNKRGARRRLSFVSSGLSSALLAFTLFYRPSVEYAVETAQVEHVDEDDDGDPETKAKALNRQLKRIRRGEKVESLVVRLQLRL